jgi:hypothetical protein
MSDFDAFDEDITRQIAAVAADPQTDLPATVRAVRLENLDTRKRVRRVERAAWWVAMSVLAGSAAVVIAIASAAYGLGVRMSAFDQLARDVADLDHRLAQIEEDR